MATETDVRTTDRIYAGVAVVAAALAVVEHPAVPWAPIAIGAALIPWAVIAAGVRLPLLLFLALAVLPVVALVVADGTGVAVFMTTAAASRLASRTDDRRAVVGATALVAAVPFLPLLVNGQEPFGAEYFAFGDVFGVLVGVLLRRAERLSARLREADARLAEARQRSDRQRIARDVHDLVAHSLTVVVLHIGGARRVLRADPAAAESALADAERVCRESLDGIRGVVGLLRDAGGGGEGVSLDLGALVDTYRAAGVPVQATTDGDPSTMPLAVRVTLYRVLQESLANAARYAPAGTAVLVAIAAGDGGAAVRVENELGAHGDAGSAGGFGLRGLCEQVAGVDGVLTGGPEGDRWVVACRLPVRRPAALAGGEA